MPTTLRTRPLSRGMSPAVVLYAEGNPAVTMSLSDQVREANRQLGLKHAWPVESRTLGADGLSLEVAAQLLGSKRLTWLFAANRAALHRDPLEYLALISLLQRHRVYVCYLATGQTLEVSPYTVWQEVCQITAERHRMTS